VPFARDPRIDLHFGDELGFGRARVRRGDRPFIEQASGAARLHGSPVPVGTVPARVRPENGGFEAFRAAASKLQSNRCDFSPPWFPAGEMVMTVPPTTSDDIALERHARYRGKVQTAPKCPIRGFADFGVWYTPGVAAPCRAIRRSRELVYDFTNKGNTIAIVSDGSRVLGLGDIGPEAGLPVMEGKALLFKYLGGVDAVPICLGTKDPDEIVRTVEILEPSFGGINLEDIAQPKCFAILDRLRASSAIPVWHDDQQGTATVVLAALTNALKVVGKAWSDIRVAMIGVGAANVATYRLLVETGLAPGAVVACDRRGILHGGRHDVEARQTEFVDKWRICRESNADQTTGGIAEALRRADVCIAFSSPGPSVIRPEWIGTMNRDPIVFACASPVPEISPAAAREAGAVVVATGRGDFPKQLNNSLSFPAVFRGALDVRARSITAAMVIAAANELAAAAESCGGLGPERILPRMDEWEIYPRIAAAVGMAAQESGAARLIRSYDELRTAAGETIRKARDLATELFAGETVASGSG